PRQRSGNFAADPRPDFRAVLHHQARGGGNRAGAGHRLSDRAAAPRAGPRGFGAGQDVVSGPPAVCGETHFSVVAGDHTIANALAFVERHGYAMLFAWVLAEQSAIPLPSIPLLLAAGALIRAGRLQLAPAAACCVAAAAIGDTIWFQLGKRRGRRV